MPVDILIIWVTFEPGAQSKFISTSISVSDVFLETEACLDMIEREKVLHNNKQQRTGFGHPII